MLFRRGCIVWDFWFSGYRVDFCRLWLIVFGVGGVVWFRRVAEGVGDVGSLESAVGVFVAGYFLLFGLEVFFFDERYVFGFGLCLR